MSDRKYRQHGYQDSREKTRQSPTQQARPQDMTFGPRPLNMPGARTVSRCAVCGTVQTALTDDAQCPKCGLDLHSCKMCAHFDPGSRFECRQPIPERISPKDKRNTCASYSLKQSVERETSSSSGTINDARKAFDA